MISKKAQTTHHLERFNNMLRQRISRLVRASLAFAQQLANHIGAIRFFPLSLPSRESGSIPSVALPGQQYVKAMAPPAVSLRRPHELGVAQLPLGQSCWLANAAPSATARILAQPMSG